MGIVVIMQLNLVVHGVNKMKEYYTTGGSFQWETDYVNPGKKLVADHPVPPSTNGGKLWKLVSSAASGDTILWFWEREVNNQDDGW